MKKLWNIMVKPNSNYKLKALHTRSDRLRSSKVFPSMQLMDLNKRFCFLIHVTTLLLFCCMNFYFSTSQSAIIPTSTTTTTVAANQTDRIALLAFKDRINDPSGALSSWNDSFHFCTWSGVTCSSQHQRVTVLDLRSKSLAGPISPYLGNLTFLKNLTLQNNNFNGDIPKEIGRLFQLQRIDLSKNSLRGQIPINLTYCSELKFFNAMENQLEGRIPNELSSLSKLKWLLLAKNHLDGTIPVSLSNLSSLVELSLLENNLIGNIPLKLGQLSKLEFLQISLNNLSGIIPNQLFNISSISFLSAAGNQFYGTIPPDIGFTLPNLQSLYLHTNRFSGSLPNSISNASGLVILDLSHNQFTGSIPHDLGKLKHLTLLNLGMNKLGAAERDDLIFLNSLTNCSHLEKLSLSNNNLMGRLPNSIANLSEKLTLFFIGGNKISGKIPIGIENLVSLSGLGMDDNLLSGSIPLSIGKLPKLLEVWLTGNQLSGQIPSNICNNTNLEVIFFAYNRLQGRIPPSLGNCPKLQNLNLRQNQLVGTIPKQLMGLPNNSINGIDLTQNLITGNLPSEIGNLRNIYELYLSNNKLSGKIPSSLGNCLGLNFLSLDGNFFEGFIPASFENLKGIQLLDLSHNKLFGQIPKYLESFEVLKNLNLSSNDFEGEVPKQRIFKNLSAFSILGNNKLCGGVTELHLPNCPNQKAKKQGKLFPFKKMFLIIGVVTCLIFFGFLAMLFWRRKTTKEPTSSATPLQRDVFQKVSYKELLKATDGFSSANLVGVGSYGSVYKGRLGDETKIIVAVKVLDLQRRGASKSFTAECEALRCIRHRNIVKVITSCCSVDFKGNEFNAIVFEFMPNDSLDNWLHPTSNDQCQRRRFLSFTERLSIAIDVAYALEYLHHRSRTPIVHCDLKPSNVLLDDGMNGHVGDFGLAKFLSEAINVESGNHTSSVGIRGSVGYAAPEYGMGGEVSTSGDVYSYGILLLEMFTGRRPTDAMFKDDLSLHTFAKMALPGRVMQIVDPTFIPLQDDDDESSMISNNGETEAKIFQSLTHIVRIGVMCSTESPRKRMEMVQVVKEMESIKNVFVVQEGHPDEF